MKKILLILLLLSGCSSKPINPLPAPGYQRLSAIKDQINQGNDESKDDSSSDDLARNYLNALKAEASGNKKMACRLFESLVDNESFPLNQTALVHTLSDCVYTAYELKAIWKKTVIASYLKENYLEISLKLAEKYKIDEYSADFFYELVPFKLVQSEKVKLLKNAISLAQKIKDPGREEKFHQKLVEVSPLNSKEVNRDNIYSVAKDYESAREFEKARALYLEIINGEEYTLDEKIKTYNAYRTSYKVERNLKMFLEKTGEMELYLRQLLDETSDDVKLQESWVDAKTNYARAVWTEHMNMEARAILDEILERKIGSSTQLATVHWVYGSLHLESKENAEALARFEKSSEFKVATVDQQENIQWSVVWNKYLLKKYNALIVDVDKYVVKSSNPGFINKLNFWKARTLSKLNRVEEAKELFAATVASDTFGYYGLISALEINAELPPLPQSDIVKDPIGNLVLDWLIAMEEKTYSIKFLKEINSQFKTIAQRERAMSLYAQTGWYQGGMLQIYNFPMKMRDEMTKRYISVVYPTPFTEIFAKHSKKYRVPEAYPFAITRQESAFNPTVRSWADAFGLMQMIPEKAIELSKKYRIPYRDFNDLYLPDTNVGMGEALLAELRTKYKSKFIQSTAAYNASTDAIAVWERERFNGDYIEFVEMIPYEETRNYIKLVFRNFITYKRILTNEPIFINSKFFEFPF